MTEPKTGRWTGRRGALLTTGSLVVAIAASVVLKRGDIASLVGVAALAPILMLWLRRRSAHQVLTALNTPDLSLPVALAVSCLRELDARAAEGSLGFFISGKIHAVPSVMSIRDGHLRFEKIRNISCGRRPWTHEVLLRNVMAVAVAPPETKPLGSAIRVDLRSGRHLTIDLDCGKAQAAELVQRLQREVAAA